MSGDRTLVQFGMETKDITAMCENAGRSNPLEQFRKSPNSKRKLDRLISLEKRVMIYEDVVPIVRFDRFGRAKYYLVPVLPFGYVEDKRVAYEYGERERKIRRPITEMPRMKLKISNMTELETLRTVKELPFAEQLMDMLIRHSAKKRSKELAHRSQIQRRKDIDSVRMPMRLVREILQYEGEVSELL
jgi:hypothetical protein